MSVQIIRRVRDITDGRGADIVFEMVGHQEQTISDCIEIVKEGGTVVAFGVPSTETYEAFPFSALFRRNVTLVRLRQREREREREGERQRREREREKTR